MAPCTGGPRVLCFVKAGAQDWVGGHLRFNVCREVRSDNDAAIAVAPSGLMALELRQEVRQLRNRQ